MDQFVQFLDELDRMVETLRGTAERCKAKGGSMYRQGLGVGLQRSAEILAAKVAEQQALIELHAADEPGEQPAASGDQSSCPFCKTTHKFGSSVYCKAQASEGTPAERCTNRLGGPDTPRCAGPRGHDGDCR